MTDAANPNALTVTKPVSVWKREIQITSLKALFKSIGKMAIKGTALDAGGVGEAGLDTLDAAGLQNKPGEIAWLLIFRALASAITKLTPGIPNLNWKWKNLWLLFLMKTF